MKKEVMPAPRNEIVVYQPNETMRLEVFVKNETVWLTQAQIAELFGTKRPAITKHLSNIYRVGELDERGTCSILEHMGHDGVQKYGTKYYNLDDMSMSSVRTENEAPETLVKSLEQKRRLFGTSDLMHPMIFKVTDCDLGHKDGHRGQTVMT